MSAPADLRELLEQLRPLGWRQSATPPGLFHPGRTWWITPVVPGVVEVYGAGLGMLSGPEMGLGEVEGFMERMGVSA